MSRYYDDELYHHGIKGQKWGVRRYQDESGHLTSAGRERLYGHGNNRGRHGNVLFENASTRSKERKAAFAQIGLGSALIGASVAIAATTGLIAPVGVAGVPMLYNNITKLAKDSAAMHKSKKFAKERAKSPDSDMPGLKKKTRQMTPEEDMERVNPEYKNLDQNSKSNCVACTCAFEMRRRGYDVTAQLASRGVDQDEIMPLWFKGARFITAQEWDPNKVHLNYDEQTKMIDKFHKSINHEPNGSRGVIGIGWNGTYSGHSLSYEKTKDGNLIIWDTQANEKISDVKGIDELLRSCNSVDYARLDDKPVVAKYIHEVVKS